MWGAYFCMGAYKHDVVVVIKMSAYIQGVLIIPISRYLGNIIIKTKSQRHCLGYIPLHAGAQAMCKASKITSACKISLVLKLPPLADKAGGVPFIL